MPTKKAAARKAAPKKPAAPGPVAPLSGRCAAGHPLVTDVLCRRALTDGTPCR